MATRVRVIGSFLSPYVRKVLVALNLKGIEYEIDPIVPFMGGERFSEISPVRRIPVLIDERVTLCDSTVIVEYLEERHPTPALLPKDPADRARARWLEEYADTRMGEVMIWRLFNEIVIKPNVWREPADEAVLARTRDEELPGVLGYLESQLPESGLLFGDVSLADIAVASFFRNAAFARYTVDAARWPNTAAFVERVLGLEAFQRLVPFEQVSLRAPPAKLREALVAAGAVLTAETLGTTTPRRGILSI